MSTGTPERDELFVALLHEALTGARRVAELGVLLQPGGGLASAVEVLRGQPGVLAASVLPSVVKTEPPRHEIRVDYVAPGGERRAAVLDVTAEPAGSLEVVDVHET